MLMRARDRIGTLREREFSRLDATRSVYLDYTGAALYPESLVRRDARRLTCRVLGNPHAASGPSMVSTDAMEEARRLTLAFVDADPASYDVVFCANASGAVRILAEAFPFRAGSRLVLTADNHNSVNGLRVPARHRRADVAYVPLDDELRVADPRRWLSATSAPSLFAFPAQSNFSGVRHPLAWVGEAQRRGYRVLLDAAAFLPTARLSLAEVPADFVALSYYKLFGYPTGVGALIARRDALTMLQRRYFAGGTVEFASVQRLTAVAKAGGAAFEDGTPSFLAMPAVVDGLRWLTRIGLSDIEHHAADTTEALLDRLESLGDRVIVHGPRGIGSRGGTVAFNVRRAGQVVPYDVVEDAARQHGIAIRGGCFCNPGAAERAFRIPAASVRRCVRAARTTDAYRRCLGNSPVGALRASIGIPTSLADLDALHDLLSRLTA